MWCLDFFLFFLRYKGRYTDLVMNLWMLQKLPEISPQTLFLNLAPKLKFLL